tara:strand:- start:35169 stop:35513 length:345 start_codon:yes stop_codon:yes gene_type:complete
MCGDETDDQCIQCEKFTCYDCHENTTVFNAGNELPCKECAERNNDDFADDYFAEKAKDDKLRAEKDERNRKARIRYNSPEQKKKREDKKREKAEKHREDMIESNKRVMNILKGL